MKKDQHFYISILLNGCFVIALRIKYMHIEAEI